MSTHRFLIVGAGLAGAVAARTLAEHLDAEIEVLDRRDHVAGLCHTSRDAETGIMVHHHGPHIFNTDSEKVWSFVERFTTLRPVSYRVKATIDRGVFSLPINLHTINQFFNRRFTPQEARAFMKSLGDERIVEPRSLEEQALKHLGRDLYLAFFQGYSWKQWGVDPRELPAATLQRLPIRFNYDDGYYRTRLQGIPEQGYTAMVEAMLDHERIRVGLLQEVSRDRALAAEADHVFWTGPIDWYFDGCEGSLGYRTVYWDMEHGDGDLLGTAVMNFPDRQIPYTRKIEHKHFAPWERHERTVISTEYSKATECGDIPCYPIGRGQDRQCFDAYLAHARQQVRVSFMGRLGTYRYLNMDQVIGDTLEFMEQVIHAVRSRTAIPAFPSRIMEGSPQ